MNSQANHKTNRKDSFFQLPKVFINTDEYSHVSLHALLLYTIMRDRARVSKNNNWIDEDGRVYINFQITEICKALRCGHTTAIKLLDELDSEKGAGLITRKKQGFGKPCRIYVNEISASDAVSEIQTSLEDSESQPDEETEIKENHTTDSDLSGDRNVQPSGYENRNIAPSQFRIPESDTSEKYKSHCPENELSEFQSVEGNKNNINKNNINNNNFNHITSYHINAKTNKEYDMTDMAEKIKTFRKIVKDNISYELAVYNFGEEWTNGIVELMVDVICSDSDSVRINKRDFPLEIVRERFLNISYAHIENVYFTTRKTKSNISNIREYLITVIYRSYETADNWMVAKANFDL